MTPMIQMLRSRMVRERVARIRPGVRTRLARLTMTKLAAIACAATVLATAACNTSDVSEPALLAPSQAMGVIVASPGAVLLAVGGSLQLGAQTYSLSGQALTPDSVMYAFDSPNDSVYIHLSNTGMIQGLKAKPSAIKMDIIAFKSNTARMDQVFVLVTTTAVPGLTLSIHPVPPDSARLEMGTVKRVIPVVTNADASASVAGAPVQLLVAPADAERVALYIPLSYNLKLPQVAIGSALIYSPGSFAPLVGEGTAWIYGSLNAYGVSLRDSVQYTFAYRRSLTIDASKYNLALISSMNGRTMTLERGAVVQFDNDVGYGDPLSITYTLSDSTAASGYDGGPGGNPGLLTSGSVTQRQFNTPGTYVWTGVGSGGPAPWPGQQISGILVIK